MSRTVEEILDEVGQWNKKQFTEAVYWMVLGDGYLEHWKESRNCVLSIAHKQSSEDYIRFKAGIMSRLTKVSIDGRAADRNGFANAQPLLRVRSMAHPFYTKVANQLYILENRKAINNHALKLLGKIGLAILYQDDGSYNHFSRPARGGHGGGFERNVLIHTLAHSELEVMALAKEIVDKFGLIFRINRGGKKGYRKSSYRLRLRNKDIDTFFNLIEPYIVPSMLYKLGRGSTLN